MTFAAKKNLCFSTIYNRFTKSRFSSSFFIFFLANTCRYGDIYFIVMIVKYLFELRNVTS